MEEKKTVFISGSSRGIGRATAELFAQRGWNVIAHARNATEEFGTFTRSLAEKYQVTVTPICFDMQDEAAMKEQVREVITRPRLTVDALVNNAGICDIKLFMMTTVSAIRNIFDVNLFSHMRLTQLLLKRMPAGGAIVNVASVDGLEPKRGESGYAASKAALIAWTKTLSMELLGRIRVNAVAPCAVDTDFAHAIEDKADWKGKPIIDPSHIAKVIYFLSSAESADVTGEAIKIAGEQI